MEKEAKVRIKINGLIGSFYWTLLEPHPLLYNIHVYFRFFIIIYNLYTIMEKDFIPRQGEIVDVIAEFKYEPCKSRENVLASFYNEDNVKKTKFPIIFYNDRGIKKDINRIKQYVDKNLAKKAYFIFIDEGKQFRHRKPFECSIWEDWKMSGFKFEEISILWMKCEK